MNSTEIFPDYQESQNRIIKVNNAFLQSLVDQGALLVNLGGWKVATNFVQVELVTLDDSVAIKLIKVNQNVRGNGYGSQMLKALCDLADQTSTTLRLETGEVDEEGIPVHLLPTWYQKYGFQIVSNYNNMTDMIRMPI